MQAFPNKHPKTEFSIESTEDVSGPFLTDIALSQVKGSVHFKVMMGNQCGPQ